MARATHIAAMAGHTGDGIAGTITGIGTTDLDEALLMRLEVGETPKRGVWRQNAAGIVHQLDRKRTFHCWSVSRRSMKFILMASWD